MEKVNWLNLNSELHKRSEKAGVEYDKLKEKIRDCFKNEQNLNDLNEQKSIFNKNADRYFVDSYEVLLSATQEIGLDIFKKDWTNINGSDLRKEATIFITSDLPFKPVGFNIVLKFLTETNPITYRNEFTLTAQGFKSEDDGFNNSERNKLTKKIHTLRSLKDWEMLGFTTEYLHNGNYGQRQQAIESEFYAVIKDLLANSILYTQADFQTIK